jgi:hypothetical protein
MKTVEPIATITPTKEVKIQLPEALPVGTFKVVLVIDETSIVSSEPLQRQITPSLFSKSLER